MSRDILRGQWIHLKGRVKAQWGKLTDGDLDELEGHADRLVGKVQERYGLAREQAEREVDNWIRSTSQIAPPP